MDNKQYWLIDCDTGVDDTFVDHYFLIIFVINNF